MKLTHLDREILRSYIPVLEGLAAYLSDCFELVLHSLEDYEHSVVCIHNGHHTGRTVGAPITDLALKMLDEINQGHEGHIVYFSRNKKGEPLKSTTIAIQGENRRIIGLLCINMYLNTSLADFFTAFSPSYPAATGSSISESFAQDTLDLIRTALEEERLRVLGDSSILPSNRNKLIVEALYNRGIFQIKDSVVAVAGLLGISKNTIYMHILNYMVKVLLCSTGENMSRKDQRARCKLQRALSYDRCSCTSSLACLPVMCATVISRIHMRWRAPAISFSTACGVSWGQYLSVRARAAGSRSWEGSRIWTVPKAITLR